MELAKKWFAVVHFARMESAIMDFLKNRNFLLSNLHDRKLLIGRLVHGDVVEARLNFKGSCLW